MSGSNPLDPLIDQLIAVDRFVDQGLRAFDSITDRINREDLKKTARRMKRDGRGEAEITAFVEARLDATRKARADCLRELTEAGIARFVGDAVPEQLAHDFMLAGTVVRAGLAAGDALIERAIARSNASNDLNEKVRASHRERRDALHRNLWSKALACINIAEAGVAAGGA